MADSILYELAKSLKSHIEANWCGDVYASDGTIETNAKVPTEYTDVMAFYDSQDRQRVLGPQLVVIGRYQDDPTILSGKVSVPSGYIEIFPYYPNEPGQWQHEVATENKIGVNPLFPREIGAGVTLWRKLYIRYSFFMVDSDQTQEESMRLGSAALSMLENLCTTAQDHGTSLAWGLQDSSGNRIRDAFGEHPIMSYLVKSETRERGGPDTPSTGNYIYGGEIWLQVMTEK